MKLVKDTNTEQELKKISYKASSSYGVTVSTLDFESSDGGSNPPGSFSASAYCDPKASSLETLSRLYKIDPRAIRTPNRLIWSQTRYRCAIEPLAR